LNHIAAWSGEMGDVADSVGLIDSVATSSISVQNAFLPAVEGHPLAGTSTSTVCDDIRHIFDAYDCYESSLLSMMG